MIKLTANKGKVDIEEIRGSGLKLVSEICCIVKAVCTAICEDETDKERMTENMILQ